MSDRLDVVGRRVGAALEEGMGTRRLGKGADRPLNGEIDRAIVVAALESVSLVTFFDEDTPVQLLSELKPQVYVKGGDYDMRKLAETALIESLGGRALSIPFVEGYSTTALVRRIRAAG